VPVFDCSREVILPAAPQIVWDAVATKEGNAGWLFPNDVDSDAANACEPPAHLHIRQEQGESFNDLNFVIEDRGDGTTGLRYAHTGTFGPEGFEAQNDQIQQHTDFYLHTLGEYVAHFSGRPVSYIGEVPGGIQGPASSVTPDGFTRLQAALGLPTGVNEGDEVDLQPDATEALSGVVDYLRPNFMGIRTADALYCFFGRNAFGMPVALAIHAFDGRDAAQAEQTWQQFLATALA
jgi:uncharacterized protein YndB with AHSA1/START domain